MGHLRELLGDVPPDNNAFHDVEVEQTSKRSDLESCCSMAAVSIIST